MALTPFTGTITEAVLRSNFDDATATMLTNLRAGGKDQTVHLRLASLASGADLSLRSVAWTQQDDAELRILHARVTDTAARAIGVARSKTVTRFFSSIRPSRSPSPRRTARWTRARRAATTAR
jgi:hypothetical protein